MAEASNPPPGQQRPCPKPTKTGSIPFTPRDTSRECETFYFLYGDLTSDKTKTPIILLHGGPGSTSRALEPFSLLNVDYGIPVLTYDQLGCGNSTHLPETQGDTSFWTIDLFMDELENVIRHFNLATFDLWGGSWGGMLAAKFASARQPKGLRKILITSSPAKTATRVRYTRELQAKLPAPHAEALAKAERDGIIGTPEIEAAKAELLKRHLCRVQPPPPQLIEGFKLSAADKTVYSTMYGSDMLRQDGPMKDWDIEEELRLITPKTAPGGVLVMNGKHDVASDEVVAPFWLNPTARTKWVRFAESSHLSILEETETVVATVGKFLLSK